MHVLKASWLAFPPEFFPIWGSWRVTPYCALDPWFSSGAPVRVSHWQGLWNPTAGPFPQSFWPRRSGGEPKTSHFSQVPGARRRTLAYVVEKNHVGFSKGFCEDVLHGRGRQYRQHYAQGDPYPAPGVSEPSDPKAWFSLSPLLT